MALGPETIVGVVGAGAMGSGIAQVAARNGHQVMLADENPDALKRASADHLASMEREAEKGRLTREEAKNVIEHITYVPGSGDAMLHSFAPCGLVVEAIVERVTAKQELFATLEGIVSGETVLASNTSALSIAALGGRCEAAERVIGVHFFNPAPVMPLVEIVPSLTTSAEVTTATRALIAGWRKTTVIAADTPGFIVNRIARPFYGEALRIVEEGIADCSTVDWAMREIGGFKMGPFELMDFIGNDVNYAVTCSVFEAMFYDPRYRPALMQGRLVEAGRLGRKSARGYYDYRLGAVRPEPSTDREVGERVVNRIVAMLINEAVEALSLRVASAADIELAMTKGVNYPKGLLAWGDDIGAATVLSRLAALQEEYGEDRYRPSPLLRRLVASGRKILS
jgi:3-hydroxybutyryl-CoA dehydrogenase